MATATTATPTNTPSRKKLRAIGRKKRQAKIASEPEFKKSYFEGKSKRANEKKAAFRKKKKGKK